MKCPVGTELRVVSIVDFSEPYSIIDGAKEREITAARELVEEAVQELQTTHPHANVSGVVLDGDTVDEILEVSRQWLADLIIVGTHGRKGLSRLLLGSVSRAVLLHAPCAVRIVRAPAWKNEPLSEGAGERVLEQRPGTGHVLICLDDSEYSTHLIDHVLALPWAQGTKFRCLYVIWELVDNVIIDPDTGCATTISQHFHDMIHLQKRAVDAAAHKINETFNQEVATAEIAIGDPRNEIIEMAKNWPADIIMMGSHGRHGIEKLIMGSVSEGVAIHANCTVEVARIPAQPRVKCAELLGHA